MAGFLGLFDYTKNGKGVKKNRGKEKKSFFVFMELVGRKFGDLVLLNLIFMLFCLPIFTIGPALVARSYILREFVKEKPVFLWSDFKERFFKEFKQACPVGLIHMFMVTLLGLNYYYLIFELDLTQTVQTVATAITGAILLILTFVHYYVYTMIVTLELPFSAIYKNGVIFAFQGFLKNMIIIISKILFWAVVALMVYFSFTVNAIFLFLAMLIVFFFAFSFDGLIEMFGTYPTIKKYLIPEDIEDDELETSIFNDDVL